MSKAEPHINVYKSDFAYGDRVVIDDDKSIVATVLAVMFRGKNSTVQVSWMNGGQLIEPWIEDWRLTKWEE